MNPSILLVRGGRETARDLYKNDGRVEWAQAIPLVLEKLGYLGVEVASPEILDRRDTWDRYAAVLVTSAAARSWSQEGLERSRAGSAQIFLELPGAPLAAAAGVRDSKQASPVGALAVVDSGLQEAVAEFSERSTIRLQPPQSRPVERDSATDWQSAGPPIDDARAKAWGQLGWDVERWAVADDSEVIAEWIDDASKERWPAIVRDGNVTASCFSLLGFLGQQTTVQPFGGAEHISWGRSGGVEATLMFLLDEMHRRAGQVRPRILPWPEGVDWVLNVRHDFDRARTRAQVEQVLKGHAKVGTSATWYWRSRHLSKPGSAAIARRVAATPGHEVALHTEQLWISAEQERIAVEAAIRRPVKGTSAHGDPTCFRWQGAPNVLWAEEQGLEYTEFISHAHMHPHRFAKLEDDGTVEPSEVICLPHHESFDRSMEAGDVAEDTVLRAAQSHMRAGGMLQVLNHPDIHLDELFSTLARVPTEGRLDWTAAGVADWWRRTHTAKELKVDQDGSGLVRITSAAGVRGAVIELLAPDGARRRFVLHIEAGESVTVGGTSSEGEEPRSRPDRAWTEETAGAFADTARDYYAAQGIDAAADSARSTIAINSDLVPGRVDTIRRYLDHLGGITSLSGMRVLDCGAGFGAFAAYLSQERDAPQVTAVDTRGEFIDLATRVAEKHGLHGIDYRVSDMRNLEELEDGSFELVVANNSFIYLTTKEEMEQAIGALARVTSPGGHVLLAHANKWQAREPFTQDPLVHLLPNRAAGAVSRLTGWEHNHGRVRLISPPALRRMMLGSGFESADVGALAGARVVGPPRAYWSRFYAILARRSQ